MIKFLHKKHMHKSIETGKIIIYYNFLDIFLGVLLTTLVAFFIHDYLSHALAINQKPDFQYISPIYTNQPKVPFPIKKP